MFTGLDSSERSRYSCFAVSFSPDEATLSAQIKMSSESAGEYGFGMDPSLYDQVSAPILFIGAQQDADPTPRQLHEIVGKLNSRGKTAELVLVDARHGFAERSHDGYNAVAALESWKQAMRFLTIHQR